MDALRQEYQQVGKPGKGMSKGDIILKRLFDITASFFGLVVFLPIIAVCWVIAAIETRSNGFFVQKRIGQHGKIIHVVKIKTMKPARGDRSPIAAQNLASITRSGAIFRRYKLDELPQLFNVLAGQMSFVGPRPDVPGYADKLTGEDRIVLALTPGITGPASIKYKDEEEILASVDDPASYNDKVIWPDKVRINKEYYFNYSFAKDIQYITKTILG